MLDSFNIYIYLFSREGVRAMVKNKNEITVKYIDYLLSFIGAVMVSFAFGVWLNVKFSDIFVYLIILGVLIHGYGMYQIKKMNT